VRDWPCPASRLGGRFFSADDKAVEVILGLILCRCRHGMSILSVHLPPGGLNHHHFHLQPPSLLLLLLLLLHCTPPFSSTWGIFFCLRVSI
jgi:hypothetical protein